MLVPAFTFVATVEPVVLIGAVPIIVDVGQDTITINPDLIDAGVRAVCDASLRPVGIIAVDLFGQSADYESLSEATRRHELWIIGL